MEIKTLSAVMTAALASLIVLAAASQAQDAAPAEAPAAGAETAAPAEAPADGAAAVEGSSASEEKEKPANSE